VGSKTFDGVWFISFSDDHLPPHVHGKYAETQVIVELLSDEKVVQSDREDAIEPKNAKRSDVRRIMRVAASHALELHELWRRTHGSPS
jgi:Domain of unknown function (DUF4160)